MEPFLGMIILVPYNFAPRGWMDCDGTLLPINNNTALFSLLGTTYGGDGVTTFAIPDLRGRIPVGIGQGPSLSVYDLGQVGGAESVQLTTGQLPSHSHTATTAIHGTSATATATNPSGNMMATPARPDYAPSGAAVVLAAGSAATTVGSAGSNQSHENRQPYLGLRYIMATEGIFPARN